jgi:hypothetical protein
MFYFYFILESILIIYIDCIIIGLHPTKPGIGWEADVWRQILYILYVITLHFNISNLNCKISD